MTTLAAAVAVGDQQLIIDAPMAGPFPGWVKIDDEVLKVGGSQYREGTTLPLSEAATAAHESGATVTYASRPYSTTFNEAIGAGSGEQTVRLLGPFEITFQTDLENVSGAAVRPYHELVELDPGVTVVRVVALTRVPWVLASGATAVVLAVALTDLADGPQAHILYADRVDENWVGGEYAFGVIQTVEDPDTASTVGTGFTMMAAVGAPGAKLVCVRNDPSGACTAGETDIYALIAEPAA